MDIATAKLVLSAYRTDRQDANDPVFAEALRAVAADPEMAAWFAEEQRFDSLVRSALEEVPTPAGLKDLILLNAGAPGIVPLPDAPPESRLPPWWRQGSRWLAAAACVMLAFVVGRQTRPGTVVPIAGVAGGGTADGLGLQAIAYTSKMPALQFVCFSSKAVANWIDAKSAEMHMGTVIEKPLASMQMIGSSTAEWDGKPVIMVALQNGKQMAMLYVVRAADFPGASVEGGHVMEKDGWVSKTGRNGDHVYVLATKGTRENLNFPMPL